MTTTAATIRTTTNGHWYYIDGRPCYELPKKDGKGMKSPTLADARKLNLLPSVTNILNVIDKPALNDWKVTQGVMAVMTTPQKPGESLDDFIHRVLHVERVQDQEVEAARDKGIEIHTAMEAYFLGQDVSDEIRPWIAPAAAAICNHGQLVAAEKILVGDGYAGKTDLIQESPEAWLIWDFKTTKSFPDRAPWKEHTLQLAAYAAAYWKLLETAGVEKWGKPIRTYNCYISTVEQGKFAIYPNPPDWQRDYNEGFVKAMDLWKYYKQYKAQQ